MFCTFPDSWPGAGLLILRVAAGAGLIVQGTVYFANHYGLGLPSLGAAVLADAFGALLLTGCLTRYAAVFVAVASVASVFSWFPTPKVGLFETHASAILAVVIAAALVCLGPGAFSVDARLFGQREVIIPADPHDSDA